jgi:transcriptional regulator with XRE-family HTH domain
MAMRLARRIRKARRRAGLSQHQLAVLLGVGRSSVANWEGEGSIAPPCERLLALASVLGVNFEWLATGRGEHLYLVDPDETPAADLEVVDDPLELRLLRAFRQAQGREQRRILEAIESRLPKAREAVKSGRDVVGMSVG